MPAAPKGNTPNSASTATPRACARLHQFRHAAGKIRVSASASASITRLKPSRVARSTQASAGHSLNITAHGTRADSAAARPKAPYHSSRAGNARSGRARNSPLKPTMTGARLCSAASITPSSDARSHDSK